MGDRGTIFIVDTGIFLCTHWTGSELPKILRDALKRGQSRWNDPAYLTRIIFCEMIRGDNEGTTGFGISNSQCDYGAELFVHCAKQTVILPGGDILSFSDFCK